MSTQPYQNRQAKYLYRDGDMTPLRIESFS